jgi:para-aminobenzoate synthetase component 1
MTVQEVDLSAPPSALVERLGGLPFLFALDGGGSGSWACGRAIIGVRPRSTLHVNGDGSATVVDRGAVSRCRGNPFDLLERFRRATRPRRADALCGGIVVALSYDLRSWVEPRLARRPPADALVLFAAGYDGLLSYDYQAHRYEWRSSGTDSGALAAIAAAAAEPRRVASIEALPVHSDSTPTEYSTAVGTALDYIAAGDIYQVNLSQRFVADGRIAPLALYSLLQREHPMPFSAFVDCGELALVSNSPECFLLRDGNFLSTYPIKGTRARSADTVADRGLAAELCNDAKELAEHLMIVDLERNDLGRVCRTGSVRVEEFAGLRSYPSLHHLISQISGEVGEESSTEEIVRAMFPGGSITGAPKIRAMQIIDELEPMARGFYTGSIGFIDDCGRATLNIAIRTAVVSGGGAVYHAGGGIVADSDPAREYEETLLKAYPFITALRARAA